MVRRRAWAADSSPRLGGEGERARPTLVSPPVDTRIPRARNLRPARRVRPVDGFDDGDAVAAAADEDDADAEPGTSRAPKRAKCSIWFRILLLLLNLAAAAALSGSTAAVPCCCAPSLVPRSRLPEPVVFDS